MHTEFLCTRLTECDLSNTELRNGLFYHCALIDLYSINLGRLDADFTYVTRRKLISRTRNEKIVSRVCDLRHSRYPGVLLSEIGLQGSQVAGVYADAKNYRVIFLIRFKSQILHLALVSSLIGCRQIAQKNTLRVCGKNLQKTILAPTGR